MLIRAADPTDVADITALYGHYVLHGTASFEIDPPAEADMAARLAKTVNAGWPWLVATGTGGELLGYAYASQFRDRAAYRFVCEDSIYIRHDRHGLGIGKTLLAALIEAATACEFRQMIAVIAGGEPASVGLHAAAGFHHIGRLEAIGRKQGRWLDTVYMQLALGPGDSIPPRQEPQ